MPVPVPTPTAAQIVTVAEIAMVTTDHVSTMVAADSIQEISDAKWEATLADIAAWASVGRANRKLKRVDQIEFFEGGAADQRLDLRNSVRQRYGLPLLASDSGQSCVDMSSLPWF